MLVEALIQPLAHTARRAANETIRLQLHAEHGVRPNLDFHSNTSPLRGSVDTSGIQAAGQLAESESE